MFKTLISLLFLLQGSMQQVAVQPGFCNCPTVTNLQQTGKSASTISISWSGVSTSGYTVKYGRQEDGYTSPEYVVSGASYSFTNLPSGHYVFYVATNCGEGKSDFIGVEDIIEN